MKTKVIRWFCSAGCLIFFFATSAFALPSESLSKADYISLLTQKHKTSSMIPRKAASMSKDQLYRSVVKLMGKKKINFVSPKEGDRPLTRREFIDITYAFITGKPGNNFIERKYFLKNKGIINPKDIGLIQSFEGFITFTRHVNGETVEVTGNEPIVFKDVAETDEDSRIRILFDDMSDLTLGEETALEINEMIFDPKTNERETLIKIAYGKVKVEAAKLATSKSTFKVETPTAVVGVRGTKFIVIVDRSGITRIITLEGLVAVEGLVADAKTGKAPVVLVKPNEATTVETTGGPSVPVILSAEEISQMNMLTTVMNPIEVVGGGIVSIEEATLVVENEAFASAIVITTTDEPTKKGEPIQPFEITTKEIEEILDRVSESAIEETSGRASVGIIFEK